MALGLGAQWKRVHLFVTPTVNSLSGDCFSFNLGWKPQTSNPGQTDKTSIWVTFMPKRYASLGLRVRTGIKGKGETGDRVLIRRWGQEILEA